MTHEQLQTICDRHGGQTAVALITGYNKAYINRMVNAKDKITNTVTRKFHIFFPKDFEEA